MPMLRHMTGDMARAFAVLAMVLLCLGSAPADSLSGRMVVTAPGTPAVIVSSLCGHEQQSVACHAPTNCCRPDYALLPQRAPLLVAAFGSPAAVAFGVSAPDRGAAAARALFQSRAPPLV